MKRRFDPETVKFFEMPSHSAWDWSRYVGDIANMQIVSAKDYDDPDEAYRRFASRTQRRLPTLPDFRVMVVVGRKTIYSEPLRYPDANALFTWILAKLLPPGEKS